MSKRVVNMLCIRDSDFENSYVFDAEVHEVTIDLGGSWSSTRDFADDLRKGDGDALEYVESTKERVAHLPEDNPVRKAVYNFFEEAKEW